MLPVLRTVQVVADAVVIVDVVDRPDAVLLVDEIINKVSTSNLQIVWFGRVDFGFFSRIHGLGLRIRVRD